MILEKLMPASYYTPGLLGAQADLASAMFLHLVLPLSCVFVLFLFADCSDSLVS